MNDLVLHTGMLAYYLLAKNDDQSVETLHANVSAPSLRTSSTLQPNWSIMLRDVINFENHNPWLPTLNRLYQAFVEAFHGIIRSVAAGPDGLFVEQVKACGMPVCKPMVGSLSKLLVCKKSFARRIMR